MDNKIKGGIYGCAAAVSYGMNPLCALFLYEDGLSTYSVLTYRFSIGTLILGLMMLVGRQSFALSRRDAGVLAILGILFAASSITYFLSFKYMGAGIAATLVFAYPVMTAIIMALFFHERLTRPAFLAILMTIAGIVLLYRGNGEQTISLLGFIIIMLSALFYAVYIVVVNRSHVMMSSVKLTFYAMLVCLVCIVLFALCIGEAIQPLTTTRQWFFASFLGLVPTVISLVTMAIAIRYIGSTPTAIMGALEPVTAVAIGIGIFGEVFTLRLGIGILLILAAVLLIIVGSRLPKPSHVWHVMKAGHLTAKFWRWRA